RRAFGAAPAARGRTAEPAFTGEVAGGSGASFDGAGGGEPVLANVLRDRPCKDGRELRVTGRSTEQPATARLACDGVHSEQVGCQGNAAAHRDVGCLSNR